MISITIRALVFKWLSLFRQALHKVAEITTWKGLKAFDMDKPISPELDSARRRTRVDSIHKGLGLSRAYAGDSVVIGIIDAGFDYAHPAFYDTSYNQYRV